MTRFIKLEHALLQSEEWRQLKPYSKLLYIELLTLYNGRNNGTIKLSLRQAAKRTGFSYNTVMVGFQQLEKAGLIEAKFSERNHLGMASEWSLKWITGCVSGDARHESLGHKKPIVSDAHGESPVTHGVSHSDARHESLVTHGVSQELDIYRSIDGVRFAPAVAVAEKCAKKPSRKKTQKQQQELLPKRATESPQKPKKEVTKKEPEIKPGAEAWKAYSISYEHVYGVKPVPNAKQYSLCTQLVKRLGATDAVLVAAWYPTSGGYIHRQGGHPLALLVRDCEQLRTSWANGRQITQVQARQEDAMQARKSQAERIQQWIEEEG